MAVTPCGELQTGQRVDRFRVGGGAPEVDLEVHAPT
jgi:hypothetical protein